MNPRSWVTATLLAWVAMIGIDLLLHAGLLAPLYDWDSPFLLSPQEAFVRIPAGYLAFGVLAGGLVWLIGRIGIRSPWEAARIGAIGGAVVWGALLLGMWSISSADPSLLAAWWVGQTAQLAIGGYVAGLVLTGARLRSVAWGVVAILLIGAVVAVVLQSIGYAPAPVIINAGAVSSDVA
jgi:hypothetical protein